MPFSYRRALGLTAAAVATSTAALAAQAPAPPQVTVGGLVYTQYVYQLKDSVNHFNNFDITRAYLNVLGRFAGGVTARLTVDVQRFGTIATTPPTTDNSLRLRLKYAFATYTPPGSPVTFKAGLIHTPWLDWEEAVWDYRMQGTMATDRAGYLSAADYGVGVDGKWMADKVNFQFTVVNGTFYSGTSAGAGKDALAENGAPVVSTRVTVTGKLHWFTAYAYWSGMPQPRMVGPKSTVGGVTKKQLTPPDPTRSTVIDGADRLLT